MPGFLFFCICLFVLASFCISVSVSAFVFFNDIDCMIVYFSQMFYLCDYIHAIVSLWFDVSVAISHGFSAAFGCHIFSSLLVVLFVSCFIHVGLCCHHALHISVCHCISMIFSVCISLCVCCCMYRFLFVLSLFWHFPSWLAVWCLCLYRSESVLFVYPSGLSAVCLFLCLA